MKNILLFALLFICGSLFSQENYSWTIVDTVPKTKDLLYKDRKVFIAKTWKSAQSVI